MKKTKNVFDLLNMMECSYDSLKGISKRPDMVIYRLKKKGILVKSERKNGKKYFWIKTPCKEDHFWIYVFVPLFLVFLYFIYKSIDF